MQKISSLFGVTTSNNEAQEEEVVSLPEDFTLLVNSNTVPARIARNYLFSRGFSEKDLYLHKPGISKLTKFTNRIIFPSFNNNLHLNFFVSRTYDDNQKIKYRNCKAINENKVDFKRELVLVEGVFDLAKVQRNCCCILGSWFDQNYLLFEKIVKNKTPIILALDPDAIVKSRKIANLLTQYCVNVKIVEDLITDVGSMSKHEVETALLSAKHYDNTDRLRYLISGIKSGSVY